MIENLFYAVDSWYLIDYSNISFGHLYCSQMKCFILSGNLDSNYYNMDCSDVNMEHFD